MRPRVKEEIRFWAGVVFYGALVFGAFWIGVAIAGGA